MHTDNLTKALSTATFAFLLSIATSPAADTSTDPALATVAKADSTLRAALESYERSKEQLSERFGKELAKLNEGRLKALEQAFARASTRRDTEAVASLAELINSAKAEQPKELTNPQVESPLVGTAFRWGSFVMFLAPNGVSWFVNMAAEKDVHRFAWKPAGTNKIKWKTTHPDPKKQNGTITMDGDKFLLEGDDTGTKENGAVFRP
jgi:hypothetical protein